MLEAAAASDRAVLSEPIVGWRTWTVVGTRDGTDAWLLPIAGTGKPWPFRVPVSAECARRRWHRVPGIDCTCGIHATRSTELLRRTRNPAAIGRVALWGRVLEHLHGYRAEHGYPQRLALVCALCLWQRGAEGSAAPDVVVRLRGGRLVPHCAPHLELCLRYGYPARRFLEPAVVERALLDAYAIDPLPSLRTTIPA
jgi:hypothetical protein